MANLTVSVGSATPYTFPVTELTLKAEKVTEKPERWFLNVKGGLGVSGILELTTAELDELFMAYEMIKPIARNADNFRDSSGPIG